MEEFISAGSTNTSVASLNALRLQSRNKDLTSDEIKFHQIVALEETKATLARLIYNNMKTVGDDIAFHGACKTYVLQTAHSRRRDLELKYKQSSNDTDSIYIYLQIIFSNVEYWVVSVFGRLNNWGASVTRPLIGIIVLIILFGLLYFFLFDLTLKKSFAKAFEISLVAGYTKGADNTEVGPMRIFEWLNLVFGLALYSVFLATVVARISRVR